MHVIDPFGKEDLVALHAQRNDHCVSLYMPTHRKGAETEQDPIRLKNLLDDAEQELKARGARWDTIEAILGSARKLLDREFFWQHLADGLAVFATATETRCYRTGIAFQVAGTVSDRFNLGQMIRLLTSDGQFYILALGEQTVKLLEGTRYRVFEIDVDNLPSTIGETLSLDDPQQHLQFHTGAGPSGEGGRRAIFHGHGGGDGEDNKERLKRFFNIVDRKLEPIFKHYPAPVVLVAVDYYLHLYREVANVPGLIEGNVSGNPDVLRNEELHAAAWDVVYPVFKAEQQAALQSYESQVGTGRTTLGVADTGVAAFQGRVESLFVDTTVEAWGAFDESTQRIEVHEVQNPQDLEIVSEAALATLAAGGKVFTMPKADIPGGEPIAAILRYAS